MAVTPADALLRALNAGIPITGEDGKSLLSTAAGKAIAAAVAAVDKARSHAANRERAAFWVTGQPGNGKTQSLRQLVYQLPRTAGQGKYALAVVDFDKEPDARRPAGLVPAIVRQCLFAGVTVGGLEEARTAATQGQSADANKIESLAFGIDVLASLAGLPPVSLLASRGLQRLWTWWRSQGSYIRKNLRKRWPNPQLVEFLGAWVDYVLRPTPRGEADFSAYLSRLATNNQLFDLFGYAL
jgi:hypothetical protein